MADSYAWIFIVGIIVFFLIIVVLLCFTKASGSQLFSSISTNDPELGTEFVETPAMLETLSEDARLSYERAKGNYLSFYNCSGEKFGEQSHLGRILSTEYGLQLRTAGVTWLHWPNGDNLSGYVKRITRKATSDTRNAQCTFWVHSEFVADCIFLFPLIAWQTAYPPESVPTDITLSQYLTIQEKGVAAFEFEADMAETNAFIQGRTEIQFFRDECCVQTNLPFPKNQDVYYFEAKMYEKPISTTVAVGVGTKPFPNWRMPGRAKFFMSLFSLLFTPQTRSQPPV